REAQRRALRLTFFPFPPAICANPSRRFVMPMQATQKMKLPCLLALPCLFLKTVLFACCCLAVPLVVQAQGGNDAKPGTTPKAHDNAEARRLTQQAEPLVSRIEYPDLQQSALEDIGIVKAEAGDFEGAR